MLFLTIDKFQSPNFKLQINSNDPITKQLGVVWNLNIEYYLVIGAWCLVIGRYYT